MAINPLLYFLPEDVKNNMVSSAAGGYMRSSASVYRTLAGIARDVPVVGKSVYQTLSRVAEKSEILSQNTGDGGFASEVIKFAAGTPTDLAQLGLLTKLPGGAYAAFPLHGILQSRGSGGSVAEAGKEGLKGLANAGIFGLGGIAGNVVAKDATEIGKAIFKPIANVGTVFTLSAALEKNTGADWKSAITSAGTQALFALHGALGEQLKGKTARVHDKEGHQVDLQVDEKGDINEVEGVTRPDIEIIKPPTPDEVKSARELLKGKGFGKNEVKAEPVIESKVAEKPVEPEQPKTLVHPNEAINGKPIVAETAGGKVVVANPENKSGVSVVTNPEAVPVAQDAVVDNQGKEAIKQRILDAKPVEIRTDKFDLSQPTGLLKAVARNIYRTFRPVETQDGKLVRFSPTGLKETLQHIADRRTLQVIPHLPELIKRADLLWSEPSRKESRDTFHNYVIKTQFDGQDAITRISVREDVNGNFYYDNHSSTTEQLLKAPESRPHPNANQGATTQGLSKD